MSYSQGLSVLTGSRTSAQIMPEDHVDPVVPQRLGHEQGRTTVIVRCFEASCRGRKGLTRRVGEIEGLRKFTAIGVNIEMFGNAREDQIVSCPPKLHGKHILLFARQYRHDSRLAALAIGDKDRWATGGDVIVEDVAYPQH